MAKKAIGYKIEAWAVNSPQGPAYAGRVRIWSPDFTKLCKTRDHKKGMYYMLIETVTDESWPTLYGRLAAMAEEALIAVYKESKSA